MRQSQTIRAAVLLSAGVAALSLSACNQNGTGQNGAYVAASSAAPAPLSSQPLPPSNTYQRIANTPPPPLPVYDQPPIPGPGYLWTPGYWDWSDDADDYYWVPGTWVEPPEPGYLWTPGYWRFYDGRYLYSGGYWGPEVGFYGGVDYGYGYGGNGYDGGRWQGDRFYYNSQANNFGGRHIDTVFSQGVSNNGSRVAFNGGPGGLRVAPAQAQVAAAQVHHIAPTHDQVAAVRAARAEPRLRATANGGAPPIAATARPAQFHNPADITASRSAAGYTPPVQHGPAGAGPLAGGPAGVAPVGGPAGPLAGHHQHETQPVAGGPSGAIGHPARVGHPVAPAGGPAAIVHAPTPGGPAREAHVPIAGPSHAGPPVHATGPVAGAPAMHVAPTGEPHYRAAGPSHAGPPIHAAGPVAGGPPMHAAAPIHAAPAAVPHPAAAAAPVVAKPVAPTPPGGPDKKH